MRDANRTERHGAGVFNVSSSESDVWLPPPDGKLEASP